MCLAIIAIDKRFSDVRPRHPRGGQDKGRDIEARFNRDLQAFGAVGFMNQANDSREQKNSIRKKFADDVKNALSDTIKPDTFFFLTNINLTISEKDRLVVHAKSAGFVYCEIMDRERLRIVLDSPDGFAIRYQYLDIPMSVEEQASFFARWGDDIQSVISTGFERLNTTLDRLMFLQEASDVMSYLMFMFELDRMYTADEIGHFRAFCSMFLKEPKHNILQILFGASDRSHRMRTDREVHFTSQQSGINYGISSGRWEQYFSIDNSNEETKVDVSQDEILKFKQVGGSSSIGMESTRAISIEYIHDSNFIRFYPRMMLRDIDQSNFLIYLNKSLSDKVTRIHIYANGYKIQEIPSTEFWIDTEPLSMEIPAPFTDDELADVWVRLRPEIASAFRISFAEQTPRRMYAPRQTPDNIHGKSQVDQP